MGWMISRLAPLCVPVPRLTEVYWLSSHHSNHVADKFQLIESELKPGDWAAFPGGGGGVGHMGVQLAKAMGMRVVVIDKGAQKRKLCEDVLKVDAFVDFSEVKSVEEEVIKITDGKGAHGVFVTAGSAAAYKSAPMMVRVGGRVMCTGLREYQRLAASSPSYQFPRYIIASKTDCL